MNHVLRFFFAVLVPGICSAQDTVRDHEITIDDYFSQAYISQCEISPDGNHVAYIEVRWNKEDDQRNYDLWVVDVESQRRQRLTFERTSEYAPQWAPDSRTIYFAATFKREGEKKPPYDGKTQVWRILRDGSGLNPVTQVKGGVHQFEVSRDGSAIYYTTTKDHTINDWSNLRNEFKDEIEFGHGIHKVSELWKLNLDTWRTEKLVDEARYIRSFAVSPDHQTIAMITDPDQHLISHEGKSEVRLFYPDTGESQDLPDTQWRDEASSPFGWLENPAWSSDSKHLAFSISFDGYPTWIFATSFEEDGPTTKKLPRPKDVEVNGALAWIPESTKLAFLGDHHALERIYSVDIESGATELHSPDIVVVDDFSIARDGSRIATTQSGQTYAGDLFVGSLSKSPKRLFKVNPQIDRWKLPKIGLVQWKGANGDEVEGILELPPDYDGETPLPLIVAIHGGPTASTKFCFRYWIYHRTMFPSKGYAVLLPNYRGSTGYGDTFMTELIGRENDIEVQDILLGVDAMIDRGIADPKRLGVSGWSNGGYLTNCLIATNRFQAASSGAGVLDMTIQWAEEDTPGHVINYMDGLPWNKPEAYRKASPLYSFRNGIKTATIIHVGEKDPRVPATHSRGLHRALHYYLNAPCELLIYPGAGHSLSTYTHRRAKLKWDVAWFEKYLAP